MKQKLEIVTGSLPDQNLDSLSREIWIDGRQILQIGRYQGVWKVTFVEHISIDWEEFQGIYGKFVDFVVEEEAAIKKESESQ